MGKATQQLDYLFLFLTKGVFEHTNLWVMSFAAESK